MQRVTQCFTRPREQQMFWNYVSMDNEHTVLELQIEGVRMGQGQGRQSQEN